MSLLSDVRALGATACLVAAGASILLASTRKESPLIENHAYVAREVGMGETADSQLDDPVYDVVVVGGGTAGCALASRLSEDPKLSVLLLEAGGSGVALLFSQIPAGYSNLFRTKHDHNLWTIPQANAGNKVKYWPRGKMLGGSSSMNALMFQQGAPSDYDDWFNIIKDMPGADQWKFKNFKQYLLKFEKYCPSELHPQVDVTQRGNSGPVEVGYFGNFSKLTAEWLTACANIGIPPTYDFNTASGTMGVSRMMTYISPKKRRMSTEAAYLTPEVLKRPNLRVAIHAQVTRILFEGKQAVGVEFVSGPKKTKFRVRARKEVVLSAGAVHTPQILLLSGVGPAADLKRHGIPVVADLAGVGEHLMDHPVVNARFKTKPGHSLNFLKPRNINDHIQSLVALAQYQLHGTGPLMCNVGEGAAFVRSTDEKLFPKDTFPNIMEDSTSGPDAPDLELFVMPLAFTEHGFGPIDPCGAMSMGATILRPTSLGNLKLKSTDPFDPPIIDPRYLDTEHDVEGLVRGMRLMLRLSKTQPMASLLLPSEYDTPYLDDKLDLLSDTEMEKVIRERIETLYHPTSSARMAPLSANGVVDAYLRVHTISNLRIADASIFPTIISGHTTAPCIAVAEKAADLIRGTIC